MKGRVFMSIRKRKSKKAAKGYTYQVYFDYTDKYGQKKTYIKGGFLKKTDALNHETLKKSVLLTSGEVDKINPITVDVVFKLYIRSAPIKKSTAQMYENKYKNYIGPLFGKYKIALIDNYLVQIKFDTITTLSYGSKDICLRLLNNIFKFAYINGFLKDPYKAKINLGKKDAKPREPVSEDIFHDYLNRIRNSKNMIFKKQYEMVLWIGYYTGARIGEVFALDVHDLDFESNQIYINKTLEYDYDSNTLYISSTKTDESTNTVPMPYQLKTKLLKYLENHHFDILICTDTGQYIKPGNLSGNMAYYSKVTGNHIYFHQLRHAMATRLFENDVNPKIAQRILRHKKIETTLGIYTHLKEEIALETINDIFNEDVHKPVKNLSKIKNKELSN